MAKWYLDCEFNENGKTIELISIALVADDGREYYATSSEFDGTACGPWLREHVIQHLPDKREWKSRATIRDEVKKLLLDNVPEGEKPEIWAYFASYDWVVLCQLFGRMIDLPEGMPFFCRDLKQLMDQIEISKRDLPEQSGAAHDALEDARWVRAAHQHILDHYGFDYWERK
jgi:hypothetical protein